MAKETTTLSDDFVIRGYWWLPELPDKKISGELRYEADGLTELRLDGALREVPSLLSQPFSAPLIHGQTLDGKACSLSDTFQMGLNLYAAGGATTTLYYNQLLIGDELLDPRTARFESALVDLAEFSTWVDRDPFTDENNFGSTDPLALKTTYRMPKTISFGVNTLKATLRFEPGISTDHEYQRRTFKHQELLRIKPNRKESLDWYLGVIFKFRVLLTLLFGEPINLSSIRLALRCKKAPHKINRKVRQYLDLCVQQIGKRKKRTISPHTIPFPYRLVARHVRSMLGNWYHKSDNLESMYSLYFGVLVNEGMPADFKFLALIEALEAFHRSKGRNKYASDERYEPIKNALVASIPDSVPQDFRDALKSRIRFGNEYSLRKRLQLTFRNLPQAVSILITDGDSTYIEKIVRTRNYLIHRDESNRQGSMDFRAMFNACENLKLLIMYVLLAECGLDVGMITEVMTSHQALRRRLQPM